MGVLITVRILGDDGTPKTLNVLGTDLVDTQSSCDPNNPRKYVITKEDIVGFSRSDGPLRKLIEMSIDGKITVRETF